MSKLCFYPICQKQIHRNTQMVRHSRNPSTYGAEQVFSLAFVSVCKLEHRIRAHVSLELLTHTHTHIERVREKERTNKVSFSKHAIAHIHAQTSWQCERHTKKRLPLCYVCLEAHVPRQGGASPLCPAGKGVNVCQMVQQASWQQAPWHAQPLRQGEQAIAWP